METFSALLAICEGNPPVPGEFPAQRPVTPSFDVFFDLRPNKTLSKQSWGWWFETPPCPLWRHRNELLQNISSSAQESLTDILMPNNQIEITWIGWSCNDYYNGTPTIKELHINFNLNKVKNRITLFTHV